MFHNSIISDILGKVYVIVCLYLVESIHFLDLAVEGTLNTNKQTIHFIAIT